MNAATLISQARKRAGLSQAELARRARTAQPAVSAYEAGAKDPTFSTLQRLLAAAGVELRPHPATEHPESPSPDPGGLRRLLADHREEILRIADEYGASNVRVFGSVARGDHTARSDIDLLVDLPPRRLLLNVSGLSARLSDLLGVRVDVTTPRLLRAGVGADAIDDAAPL
ncbi:MAG: helix-turn-helix domain-containing protein [Egibacteraceae bacterium]